MIKSVVICVISLAIIGLVVYYFNRKIDSQEVKISEMTRSLHRMWPSDGQREPSINPQQQQQQYQHQRSPTPPARSRFAADVCESCSIEPVGVNPMLDLDEIAETESSLS